MLVLSRSTSEKVVIDFGGVLVTVVVVEVDTFHRRVRLGFKAPPSVSVDREEIRCRKLKNSMQKKQEKSV
jgi:carbon storage regulator CsrA